MSCCQACVSQAPTTSNLDLTVSNGSSYHSGLLIGPSLGESRCLCSRDRSEAVSQTAAIVALATYSSRRGIRRLSHCHKHDLYAAQGFKQCQRIESVVSFITSPVWRADGTTAGGRSEYRIVRYPEYCYPARCSDIWPRARLVTVTQDVSSIHCNLSSGLVHGWQNTFKDLSPSATRGASSSVAPESPSR